MSVLADPTRFVNRELSWLDFQDRLLQLVADPAVPLLERAKFCAIFSSNLDEFFQVRVAALRDQEAAGSGERSLDGLTAIQQLALIVERVRTLVGRQEQLTTDVLLPALSAAGIRVRDWCDLSEDDRKTLVEYYERRIHPVLTPLSVDQSHPFPYISNLSLNLAVLVTDPLNGERRFARVKVPSIFPRLCRIGDGDDFVPVEQLIAAQLAELFPGMEIDGWWPFRVSRNADLTIDDEDAADLLEAVEMELRRRRFGRAVRLEASADMPSDVIGYLLRELDLTQDDLTHHHLPIDLTLLHQVAALNRPEIRDDPWVPLTAGRVASAEDADLALFSVIRERDLLVHHPYESFASSTEAFIAQAADDPAVQSIKMTLYRTSGDSPIARSLIRAAERGVQVAVLIELQARFDEQANVRWAKVLEEAGVHVVYGVSGLKTHAKCALVVRNDADGLRRYVHFGTGNYNSRTARLYEDLGFFTCDDDFGADATQLFNSLTGFGRPRPYRRLLVAPAFLRDDLVSLIRREAEYGAAGSITAKVNSIADPVVIDALYDAAARGVRIDLIVRGICCLRAGVPGLSETIHVRSVLGRYLEHSRVLRFGHGRDGEPLHLIGSADLAPRNLVRRVEAVLPIQHVRHVEWLDSVFEFLMADDISRWELDDDAWRRVGCLDAASDVQRRIAEWVARRQRARVPSSSHRFDGV